MAKSAMLSSVSVSVCLSVCLPVCLSVCLFVCHYFISDFLVRCAVVWRTRPEAVQSRGAGEADLWQPQLGFPGPGEAHPL